MSTLSDYFEGAKVSVAGAPDYTAGRRSRLKSMMVDGRPLGDHELIYRSKADLKRFTELQWLAISLIGCDADRELRSVRSLNTRSVPTADFEATTRDNRQIKIELGNVVDGREKRLLNVITGIQADVQRRLDQGVPLITRGEFEARFYPGTDPMWGDVKTASSEFIAFMQELVLRRSPSCTLWAVTSLYPTLAKSRGCVAYLNDDGPPRFSLRPAWEMSDYQAMLKIFELLVAKKRQKVPSYSEGCPVWLAVGVESVIRPFAALGFVQYLQNLESFDPVPFDRVLVGCYTAGVTFCKPGQRPQYTSLDTTG